MDTHPGEASAHASSTKCTVPTNFSGRWRVLETGQEVVLCHNTGQNILWSSPQPGREDVAGYCTVDGSCYITILATWGGVEQRLGIVEKSERCMQIHWFQNNTKPLAAGGAGVSPELLVRLHIRLASSVSHHKSVWQFVAPDNGQWNCTAVVHRACMRWQVMQQRRPHCARAIDCVMGVICATFLSMMVWLSILGVQEAAVALICSFLSQSMDKETIDLVHWHVRLNIELLLFLSVVLFHPLRFSMSPCVLVLISQLAGVVVARVFGTPPEHASLWSRLVYGMLLGLALISRILLLSFFHCHHHTTSRADPLKWLSVRILDEEQREVVIGSFLEDCHNALEVMEVFAMDKREGTTAGTTKSDMPVTHTRRLYQSTSAIALKATVNEGLLKPFFLYRFNRISKMKSFLFRAYLGCQNPMFGIGIYLAANPFQSFTHAIEVCSGPSTGCRYILACDVLLGRTRELSSPAPHLTPELMSRRSVEGLVYDSVTGTESESRDSARKKEFVIYDPTRVTPKYIFCVRNKPLQQSRTLVPA